MNSSGIEKERVTSTPELMRFASIRGSLPRMNSSMFDHDCRILFSASKMGQCSPFWVVRRDLRVEVPEYDDSTEELHCIFLSTRRRAIGFIICV